MTDQLSLFGASDDEPLEPARSAATPDDEAPPPDEAARTRVTTDLTSTVFVEAGAGSGKTSSLVARILRLVVDEGVQLRNIAAITFTEKAAAELRDRVRRELEVTIADPTVPPSVHERCRAAMDDVDAAAISTLHAFAQRILSEHPVEAGLPPAIEVMDEISSQVAFDERWRQFFDALLDDPSMAETLLLAFACGMKSEHFRDVATALGDNWDLASTQVPDWPDPGHIDVGELLTAVAHLVEMADHGLGEDKLVTRIREIAAYADELEATTDGPGRLALLNATTPSFKAGNIGSARNWLGDHAVDDVRRAVAELEGHRERARAATNTAVIKRLTTVLRDFTIATAEERRRNGRLEFHDLLVLARSVLRDPTHGVPVRRALHERYRYLLLDEFQDTDPIQIELAVLLASDDPDAASKRWADIEVPPGRLFFVGDPKQSIYRFRRADIALFLEARGAFADRPTLLTTNFRTTEGIIDWVNAVFGALIVHEPDSQPDYQPLHSRRRDAAVGAAVTVLGADHHEDRLSADDLRDAEARDVAEVILTAIDRGWEVQDSRTREWRPAELGDITVLLPARTSLPALERALDDAGIAYRAETSSLVWSTREVRDLMAALRAIDDPTDELSLVTALRSSIYGCGDDDLYRFKIEHGGSWNHQAPLPESLPLEHPVAEAMTHLAALHELRFWSSPSDLVERLIRERRLMELGVASGRPRDLWRRLRFIVDQARAYVDSEAGNLRHFLQWARLQSAEGARVAETVLPETDDDSVRIMTIHASKGLEFPITIVSGLTTSPGRRRQGAQVHFPRSGDAIVSISSKLAMAEYDDYKPIDEMMDHHERIRLLYVAMTRARDHLVVSLHRQPPPADDTRIDDRLTSAELLARAAELTGATHHRYRATLPARDHAAEPRLRPAAPLPARAEWSQRRATALAASRRARTLAATTIATRVADARDPGLEKGPRDLDLPPWNKGRYGTAVGRAVHAVLQSVDLVTGAGLDETAVAQAAAEGVVGREDVIRSLARAALDDEIVREAAASTFWRETYVAAPVGDVTVEGYIDLLFRREQGLVVVDYKTDAIDSAADLAAKLDRYALQGATYAVAVEAAVGEPVADVVFVFLAPGGSTARSVTDLARRMDEVRETVEELASST